MYLIPHEAVDIGLYLGWICLTVCQGCLHIYLGSLIRWEGAGEAAGRSQGRLRKLQLHSGAPGVEGEGGPKDSCAIQSLTVHKHLADRSAC